MRSSKRASCAGRVTLSASREARIAILLPEDMTPAWSAIVTWVLLKLSDAITGMRVSSDEETEGLDTVEHNEKGYNL